MLNLLLSVFLQQQMSLQHTSHLPPATVCGDAAATQQEIHSHELPLSLLLLLSLVLQTCLSLFPFFQLLLSSQLLSLLALPSLLLTTKKLFLLSLPRASCCFLL